MRIARLIMLCCLLTGAPLAVAEETIRITNGEWPPYMSKKLKHYGLASRITTEAFASQGVKVEYGFFPWARSKLLVEHRDGR